jgi:hypothetical protein
MSKGKKIKLSPQALAHYNLMSPKRQKKFIAKIQSTAERTRIDDEHLAEDKEYWKQFFEQRKQREAQQPPAEQEESIKEDGKLQGSTGD